MTGTAALRVPERAPMRGSGRRPRLAGRGAALAALTALGLFLGTGSASAAGPERGARPGSFDFYVLALSWSPGFCALSDKADEREQCRDGAELGFVVHGLWPQRERGYPTDCAGMPRNPSRAAVAQAAGLFPDEGLARYQWRKHGTCSGKSPSDYFADVKRARDMVTIPPQLQDTAADQSFTPIDLERAFVAVNKGLRTDMMSVVCRRGVLQEVRICLSKDLRGFVSCPEIDRSGCRFGDLKVKAPR